MSTVGESVEQRLQAIRERVSRAAERSGRSPQEIQILLASKKQPASKVIEAYQCGELDFGENYVQELLQKQQQVSQKKIRWHMIGRLQRNKVKQVVGKSHLIQSVDRKELAEEINRHSEKLQQRQRVLIQINVGAEESKGGISMDRFTDFAGFVTGLPWLSVCGVMSLPPLVESEHMGRTHFAQALECFERLKGLSADPKAISVLSMGTSHDFEMAIEEGATMVRLGTSVFGARDTT